MQNYQTSGQLSNSSQLLADIGFVPGQLFRSAWDKIFTAPPAPALLAAGGNGFITSSISLTNGNPLYEASSVAEYFEIKEKLALSKLRKEIKKEHREDQEKESFRKKYSHQIDFGNRPAKSIFKINQYSSGELTGTFTKIGGKHRFPVPPRPDRIVTMRLSKRANQRIKRAVENSRDKLSIFCTLTFAPSVVLPENKNDDGTVKHEYAKQELSRFLNTCSVTARRKGKKLEYIWVSEIQEESTGNIHFHILWNTYFPIKWLLKIWAQAINSVDVETVKNARHACNYIRKYLAKQQGAIIAGNRYGITSGLRESMKPETFAVDDLEAIKEIRESIDAIAEDVKITGGYISEWGFCIGVPSRSQPYRTKSGTIKYTSALPRWLSESLLDICLGEVPF